MTASKKILLLTPFFGAMLFVILYFIATLFYPGGSQADKNSIGFSWINNYWCNLLYTQAINGQPNASMPIALTAMFILCVALILFWFLFSKYMTTDKTLAAIIKFFGSIAMIVAFLLFTHFNHDLIINLASGAGVIASIGVLIVLYKYKWYKLFALGFFNFLLIGLNNYVYYTKGLIAYLPVVQKITFALFLVWICCIDYNLYQVVLTKSFPKSIQEKRNRLMKNG